MSYIERINETIEYIDKNLHRDITLEELAAQAYCSKFHYHRIFQAVVGDSIMQYIRKRRLMKAAQMLLNTEMKVIDIAVETGFNSHVSFTRLFKQTFGMAPENFRKYGNADQIMSKVYLNILQKGEYGKNYLSGPRIIHKPEIKVIGLSVRTGFSDVIKNDSGTKLFMKYWEREREIKNKINLGTRYGISFNTSDNESFTYMVSIEVDSIEKVPKGMEYKVIPSSKYAVFSYKGYDSDIKTYHKAIFYIFGIWLPSSGYESSSAVDIIEVFDERCTHWEDREVDLCIPIL